MTETKPRTVSIRNCHNAAFANFKDRETVERIINQPHWFLFLKPTGDCLVYTDYSQIDMEIATEDIEAIVDGLSWDVWVINEVGQRITVGNAATFHAAHEAYNALSAEQTELQILKRAMKKFPDRFINPHEEITLSEPIEPARLISFTIPE